MRTTEPLPPRLTGTIGPVRALPEPVKTFRPAAAPADADWPVEASLVLSALDAAAHDDKQSAADRRELPRTPYRVKAELRLFADGATASPWPLYTRDVHARGLGFITPHRLPLGYGGTVTLPAPGGRMVHVHCTLFRCREAAPGWYEGALYFNRPQWAFSADMED